MSCIQGPPPSWEHVRPTCAALTPRGGKRAAGSAQHRVASAAGVAAVPALGSPCPGQGAGPCGSGPMWHSLRECRLLCVWLELQAAAGPVRVPCPQSGQVARGQVPVVCHAWVRGTLCTLRSNGAASCPVSQVQTRKEEPRPPASSQSIPAFYFPRGRPQDTANTDAIIAKIERTFAQFPHERATMEDMGRVAKVGVPRWSCSQLVARCHPLQAGGSGTQGLGFTSARMPGSRRVCASPPRGARVPPA